MKKGQSETQGPGSHGKRLSGLPLSFTAGLALVLGDLPGNPFNARSGESRVELSAVPSRLRGKCGMCTGREDKWLSLAPCRSRVSQCRKRPSPLCPFHRRGTEVLTCRDPPKITQSWDARRGLLPYCLRTLPGHTCFLLGTEPGALGDVGLLGLRHRSHLSAEDARAVVPKVGSPAQQHPPHLGAC